MSNDNQPRPGIINVCGILINLANLTYVGIVREFHIDDELRSRVGNDIDISPIPLGSISLLELHFVGGETMYLVDFDLCIHYILLSGSSGESFKFSEFDPKHYDDNTDMLWAKMMKIGSDSGFSDKLLPWCEEIHENDVANILHGISLIPWRS